MSQSSSALTSGYMTASSFALRLFYLFAVILPVVLPFVRRAAPVFLIGAALLALLHGVGRQEWKIQLSALSSTSAKLGFSFLLWAAITCLWTPDPIRAWQAVSSGALVFISALCVSVYGQEPNGRARLYASLSMSIAALTIIVDLKTGGILLHLIHSRPEPYRYNMVLVSLVVLSFALFYDGLNLAQPVKYIAIAILFGAVFIGESESAKLSMLVGYFVLLLARFVPRQWSFWLFVMGSLCAWPIFLLKPDLLKVASSIWPSLAEQGHAAERIQIWLAYSKFALAGLPWGWGVESVSHVPMTSYYATVPELLKPDLEWLHPHNNIIQILAEMGWFGCMLAFAGSFALVVWAHSNEPLRPARSGLVAAVVIVSLVSNGFWQAWWWSAVVVSIALLSRPKCPRIVHEPSNL